MMGRLLMRGFANSSTFTNTVEILSKYFNQILEPCAVPLEIKSCIDI